jgi:tRNA threonylcarbamoyladenosine modification (KEOPS) complex  Pcc1 subunit
MNKKGLYTTHITMPKKWPINYKSIIGINKKSKRAGIKIKESNDIIEVLIESEDVAAMKASFNSITRDVQVVENASNADFRK